MESFLKTLGLCIPVSYSILAIGRFTGLFFRFVFRLYQGKPCRVLTTMDRVPVHTTSPL